MQDPAVLLGVDEDQGCLEHLGGGVACLGLIHGDGGEEGDGQDDDIFVGVDKEVGLADDLHLGDLVVVLVEQMEAQEGAAGQVQPALGLDQLVYPDFVVEADKQLWVF